MSELMKQLVNIDRKETSAIGASSDSYEEEYPTISSSNSRRSRIDLGTRDENKSAKEARNAEVFQKTQKDESSLPKSFGKKYVPRDNGSPKYFRGKGFTDYDERKSMPEPFDICRPSNSKSVEYPIKETRQLLRPGMILLSNYLSIDEQVEIVTKCRELGVGPGGFYRPSFQNGAKLHLQMLCLGKNWDPETKYKEQIRSNGSEPPGIPAEFVFLVERAILDSHALINKHGRTNTVEEVLPGISPDICIVNFYTSNGKLGLHQDRDESRESLSKGLPVVSFSIGDSAEFLYGDQEMY